MTSRASDASSAALPSGVAAKADGKDAAESSLSQVIILGASNVTLSLPWLMENLPRGFPGRLDLFAASGLGRSYGARSTVLIRELPGILQSPIWAALDAHVASPQRKFALITDIGNDLLYGFTVEQIRTWLTEAIGRLKALDAECIMTRLPLKSVTGLSSPRYYATRTLFFPGSSVSWPNMKQRACELDELVVHLGANFDIPVVEPMIDWYGIDPIHVRWRRRCEAWRHIVAHWSGWNGEMRFTSPRWGTIARNWSFAAETRKLARISLTRPQPVYRDSQLTVSLY